MLVVCSLAGISWNAANASRSREFPAKPRFTPPSWHSQRTHEGRYLIASGDQPPTPQAQAQAPQQRHGGDWLRRYKDVPIDQQEKALENDPQFRNMAPAMQEQLKQRLREFSAMTPEQQERVLQRMETWEHLTPDQKDQGRKLFQRLQQLPPDRKLMVQKAFQDLRRMTPEQRQERLGSEEFKRRFTDDERDLLTNVLKLPLTPAGPNENTQPQ
jgi:hypothetical protein